MDNQEKSRPHEEIVASIKAVIETHVKPAVAGHGGTVNFIEFKDGLLTLQMSGACSGCAGSQQTLKFGIENMMDSLDGDDTQYQSAMLDFLRQNSREEPEADKKKEVK